MMATFDVITMYTSFYDNGISVVTMNNVRLFTLCEIFSGF